MPSEIILKELKKQLKKVNLTEKDKSIYKQLGDTDFDTYHKTCILCNGHYEINDILLQYRNENQSLYLEEVYSVTNCINLKKLNKYSHYLYYINDSSLKNLIWKYRDKEAIVFVSEENNGLIVSIRKDQLNAFKMMLDELNVLYNEEDINEFITFQNKTENKMISLKKLPFKPFDFQLEDIKKLLTVKRAIIGHEQGCGKTFIASTLGSSIKGKKLVVCPESLRINWEREILMVNPKAEIEIIHSKDNFNELTKEWTIMGYRTVSKFEEVCFPDTLIIDEAHFIKSVDNWGNPKSTRAKSLLKIADRCEFVYALTGTPIPSKNLDLFNLLKIVKSEMYDFNSKKSFFQYTSRYCDPKSTRFGMDFSRNSNSQELHYFLDKVMVRRVKKEVLPHLTKQRQFLPIRPKLTKEYKDIEKRLTYPEENDTFMSLAMTGRKLLSKVKLDTTLDLIDTILSNDEQVVVVTNFIETANLLKEEYKKVACEIRGGMKDKDKQKSIDDFQNGKKQVCILNMIAGGVGITLTKAKYMVMLDYDWTPANNIQVEDRICRTGQTETCMIYYIYCDNSVFDRVFVQMLTTKSENISKVVDNDSNQFDLELEKNLSYYKQLEYEVKKGVDS